MRCADFPVIVGFELLLVPREAEITQLYSPVVVDQYILTLEIAVEERSTVEVEKRDSYLLGDFCDP